MEAKEFVKSRNKAVIAAFKGDYTPFCKYIRKYNGKDIMRKFKAAPEQLRRMTICKMICNITSEEVLPYQREALMWLLEHGSSPKL